MLKNRYTYKLHLPIFVQLFDAHLIIPEIDPISNKQHNVSISMTLLLLPFNLIEHDSEEHKKHANPLHLTSTLQTDLIFVDIIAHKQDRDQNTKKLPCRRDRGQYQRRKMSHRIENKHLSHRRAQSKLHRVLPFTPLCFPYPQTLLVLRQELHSRQQLAFQDRGDGRYSHSIDVQHHLESQRGRLEARNHNVLLHSADSVHAER